MAMELGVTHSESQSHGKRNPSYPADSYVKARPTYPPSLFERIASLTKHHERAWDVGTGNGQAADMIAEYYKSVVATDVSQPQLSHAAERANITYAKLSAEPSAEELERIVGAEGSVDLVTAATALHWFDLDKFYPIVKHVLRKPGGVFAAWTYGKFQVNPEVDKLMEEWHETLTPYRAPQSEFAYAGYKTIPFPFEPLEGRGAGTGGVEVETFEMEKPMKLEDCLLLWKSQSPVQAALEQGKDVINAKAREAMSKVWGSNEEARTATFSIYLLIGTVPLTSAS